MGTICKQSIINNLYGHNKTEVMILKNSKLLDKLHRREVSVSLENILDNSRADSGGDRDVNFLKFLMDNKLLVQDEVYLKRTNIDFTEEYYLERYKKAHFESVRHFFCRAIIQDELERLGFQTYDNMDMGNMEILRSNSNYDIVLDDLSAIIDVGLTPARNFFRGLTDLRVKNFLITTYFDDYMDDIIFSVFSRTDDDAFCDAVKDYVDGFKQYIPNLQLQSDESMYYH